VNDGRVSVSDISVLSTTAVGSMPGSPSDVMSGSSNRHEVVAAVSSIAPAISRRLAVIFMAVKGD